MALEACRDCGRMVRTEATVCPQCGVPNPTQAKVSAPTGGAVRGEEVVYQAHVHPVIYFWPFMMTMVLVLTLVIEGNPAWLRWLFAGLSAVTWLGAFIVARSMEFVVTNRRVSTRTGIVQKNSQETLLEKVETVTIDQDLLGRLLGYGTVTIVGTGGSSDEFRRISKPMLLRRVLHDQIDQRKPVTHG